MKTDIHFKRYIRGNSFELKEIDFYQDGHREWWFNTFRHREDGPAIEMKNGDKEWWLNNGWYPTENKFLKALEEYKRYSKSK